MSVSLFIWVPLLQQDLCVFWKVPINCVSLVFSYRIHI